MYRAKIEEFVNLKRSNFLLQLKQLIEIPSVKGEPALGAPFGVAPNQALEMAIELGRQKDFTVKNYDGYVCTIDMSDSPAGLDILAHLDVVPANPDNWTVCKPFAPIEKDGKIYGRGSSDDKGPALAALLAMECVRELGVPLSKNVRLILGVDEESGSSDIAHYYKTEKPAPATFSPDGNFPVYNVEKGRLNSEIIASYPKADSLATITSAQAGTAANVIPDVATAVIKGLNIADHNAIIEAWKAKTKLNLMVTNSNTTTQLEVVGEAGHAAHPESANNALTGLLTLLSMLPFGDTEQSRKISSLSKLFPHGDWLGENLGVAMSDDISDKLTLSLNQFSLDETGFTAAFDSRTPVCANKENTVNVINNNIAEYGFTQRIISTALPHHVPIETPFVQTLLKVYEDYTGLKGEGLITGGGTYVHGIENAVAFGASLPDTNNNIHGIDEFAVIDELLISAMIFAQVIIDMCGKGNA